jgi:hypothetical protein
MRFHATRLTLALLVAFGTAGCMTQGGRMGGNVGEGSVVAAIDGIADGDRQRQGVTYDMICDKGGKVAGKIAGDYVRFPGDKIADGDTCAMEVRAPIADDTGYEWFGVENGQRIKGLLYGSDKGEVKARKVSLTLYKLYVYNHDFLAKAEISFAADAAIPDAAKASGTLVCGDKSYGGAYAKAAGERDATLNFPLKVSEMKGKTCAKVVVNVDNVATYSGDTPDLSFPDPKKDVTQTFPTVAATRYTVTAIAPPGDVDVDVIAGGLCLTFEGNVCKDRRVTKFPFDKNVFAMKLVGKDNGGTGDTVSYYVAAGANGFGVFEGKELKVTDVNASLKDTASDAEKTRFNFYKDSIGADLLTPPFDADFVSGAAHAAHKADRADVTDVVFLHIANGYFHSFLPVTEESLNARAAAHWQAHVVAKKEGSADVEFIVTGKDKYFHSPSVPVSAPVADYFDFAGLVADMTGAGTGNERWRVYALKGGAMSEAGCAAEKSYYLDAMAVRHLGELAAADTKLDACEVLKEHFKADLGGYTATATLFAWDWYSLVHD